MSGLLGWKPQAKILCQALTDEFGMLDGPDSKIDFYAFENARPTGDFEVTIDGEQVHSLKDKGHGHCETQDQIDAIIDATRAKLAGEPWKAKVTVME